jgi:hypothetical protein
VGWLYIFLVSAGIVSCFWIFAGWAWFEALGLVIGLMILLRLVAPWNFVSAFGWKALLFLIWPALVAIAALLHGPN